MAASLSAQQIADFHRDGFVIARGFYNSEEMALIRQKAEQKSKQEETLIAKV